MKTAIIIPARYGSTRFPGKPLAQIAGKSMLHHVVDIGRKAAEGRDITLAVATEDQRIADHCAEIDVDCVMTSDDCATGSDRVLEAADTLGAFDVLFSLQGDAPFTPAAAISAMLDVFDTHKDAQVVTPVIPLRWAELDALKDQKQQTPFSGTTAIINDNGMALWFSKNIIPAIRAEDRAAEFSPVYQHLGLYAYKYDTLKTFVSLPQSKHEKLEGLEQLRFLENGIPIRTVTLNLEPGMVQAGVDSPEDLERAENVFAELNTA